jgi:hypothetical protein
VIPTSPAIGEMDSSLMCVILYLNWQFSYYSYCIVNCLFTLIN